MKALILIASFCLGAHAGAQVLATVGNEKITVEEFNRRLEDIRRQSVNPPTPEQFLEDMVKFEMAVQEAEKQKLQNDPLVKERFKQVLYNSYLEKQIGKKVEDIKITESEMKEFYKKNPEIRLAHILVDVRPDAKPEQREEARKRALGYMDEIKKSKRPFEELVKLYSDDVPTKEMGGDIGFQSRVTLVPVVYEAAMTMKPGEVKGMIETRFGFHIIKLIERRGYDLADKRQIRAALFDDKRARIFSDYFDKLKKSYKVEVNREALKSVR